MAENNLTPEQQAQIFSDNLRTIEKIEEYNTKINSSFSGYLDGNRELAKINSRREAIEKEILDLTARGNAIDKIKLKHLEVQQDFYKKLIEQQKESIANVNLFNFALKKGNIIAMGITTALFANLSSYILDADKAWRNLNLSMGLSGDRSFALRDNLVGASSEAARMGVSFQDLAGIQESFTEEVKNASILTSENSASIITMGKGTKMGTAEAAKMAGKFTLIGKSVEAAKQNYEEMVNESIKFGISTSAVIKEFNDNFDKAQSYTFKNGTTGVRKMAEYATKFNMSMDSVFKTIDKTDSLEGAIDAVSQLQVLGGKFAQVDPMKLLYDSRNDPEALQKTIKGLTDGMATLNKQTGLFEVNSSDRSRFKLAADAIGIPYEELIATARSAAKANMIDSILGKGMTDDQKAFITGIANINKKSGKFTVQLDAQHEQDIRNLTQGQINNLMGSKKTLDEMALANQAFDDTFKNIILAFKADLLPVLMPVANVLKDILTSGTGRALVEIGAGLTVAAGMGGILNKAMEPLRLIFPAFKNLKIPKLGNIFGSFGKGLGGGATSAVEGTEELTNGITKTGIAAEGAWKSMLAFGGAVTLIGGGIWLATKGVAAMATAFAGLSGEQIVGVTVALGALGLTFGGIIALAPLLGAAALPIIAFGGAVALIGAGIGIAAAGVGYMAKGFGEMFDELAKVNDPNLTKNLSGLVFSLTALATSALLFANPLAWIGLKNLTNTIDNISDKISTLNFSSINTGAQSFEKIANAIEKINDKKLDKLLEVAESMGSMSSLASLFTNFSNSFGNGIEVKFKDQIVPVTINLTNEIDSNVITKVLSRKLALSVESSKKGGVS